MAAKIWCLRRRSAPLPNQARPQCSPKVDVIRACNEGEENRKACL